MPIIYWAGSEESHEIAALAQVKISEHKADWLDDMVAKLPPVLDVQGNVGVVNVSGSLVNGYAGAGRLFGTLGYSDINDAVVEAVSNPDVTSILLNIDSGGGSVNGISDLAKNVRRYAAVKPIAAHADRVAASAAYWLAAAAPTVSLGETSVMGSIGTLVIHTEMSQMYSEMGVKKTVMRSGEFKALSNPYEPLSDTAKAEIQSQLDDLNTMFEGSIMPMRNLNKQQMGTAGGGREFLGKRAVAVGLADKVQSYDKAFSNVKKIDAAKTVPDNRNNSKGKLAMKHLTDEQLAQIAAGVPMAAVLAASKFTDAEKAEITAQIEADAAEAKLKADAEAKAKSDAEAASAAAAAASAAAAAAASAAAATGVNPVVAHLTSQLADANAAITAAKIEAAQFKAAAETSEPLLQIARKAIGKMMVALGGNAVAAETLDAKAAVTEFARVEETFNTKFKIGGAARSAAETEANKTPVVDPGFATAVRFTPSFPNK